MRVLSESTKMLDPKVVLTPKLIWNKIKWDKNKDEHAGFIVVRRTNAYVHLFFTIFNNSVANTMKDSLTTHFCSLNWLKQEIKDDLDFPGVMEFGCWRWLNSLSAPKKILLFVFRWGIYRCEFAWDSIRVGPRVIHRTPFGFGWTIKLTTHQRDER